MRRSTTVLILLLAAALLPLPASADQVTLTNGDRLTGSVLEYDGTQLRMKTELAGTVRIAWEAVASLETTAPLAATLSDERVVTGTVASEEEKVEIATEAETLSVERSQLLALRTREAQAAYERRLHPALYQLWEGAVDAGLSATRGNSAATTVAIGAEARRETRQDKITTHLNLLFSRDGNGGTFANALRTGGRYDYNLGERLFTFGLTEFEFDQLQDLNLRWVLGGGLGWRLAQTPRTSFEVFGGGSFNQEYFEGETARRSGEALLGEELSYKLTARTTLKEQLQLFPNLTETGEYRITLDSSAVHQLSNWLSWQATLSNRFLSNPPEGRERNDLLFTTGIRLTFGAPAR